MSLHAMAEKMAFFLARKGAVEDSRVDVCGYGLELLLSTVINGILVIAISLLMGVFWKSTLLLVPFILIRSNAGGYHAKTHLGCMVGFVGVFSAALLAARHTPEAYAPYVGAAVLTAAAAIVLIIGALPHHNRPVTRNELVGFKAKARLLSLTVLIVGLIGLHYLPSWFYYFALGMGIAAGSMLAGCKLRASH